MHIQCLEFAMLSMVTWILKNPLVIGEKWGVVLTSASSCRDIATVVQTAPKQYSLIQSPHYRHVTILMFNRYIRVLELIIGLIRCGGGGDGGGKSF